MRRGLPVRWLASLAALPLTLAMLPQVASAAPAGAVTVAAVTVNEQAQPLGIGAGGPRLAWTLASTARGQRPTGYRVLVASRSGLLRPGLTDVWDSGLVSSSEQAVGYEGPALRSSTRYWWRVQVLDALGRASRWSDPTWFETGLLAEPEWTGQWIGGRGIELDPAETSFEGASWVWHPEGGDNLDMPAATRYLRGTVTLPDKPIRSAHLLATADDEITAYVGGVEALASTDWRAGRRADVTAQVRPGVVVLAARATNTSRGPAGLLARLRVRFADGTVSNYDAGAIAWRTSTTGPAGWERSDFDDSSWAAARTLATWGSGPWGDRARVLPPTAPAPLLRTEFAVAGRVKEARLYYSSPGYGELSLNGRKLGDSVLDPAFTRFDKRVQYVTRDITRGLRQGSNALGAVLGRGFYGMTTPNVWNHHTAPWHGEPRLRAQLRIEYTDGRIQRIVSDDTWRTTESPILHDSLYTGETYDARREIRGWNSPGGGAGWQPVKVLPAPTATVVPQEHEPIRVVKTHRAAAITNPKPGTYVYRFPVTLAGWARLRVTGPAGTTVRLAFGEKLRQDGTVNNDNGLVTGEHQVDRYTLRGGGQEVWEPRFSYKGFTYVQVDGLPGQPTTASVEARELHTAVASTGEFTSSNALINQLHAMTRQSILNNLHGIPTDTPMFEKNGWLGDALLTSEAAIANFGMHAIYRKWLDDIRDSRYPDNLIPLIAPTGGWGQENSVEWGAAYPLIVWNVYQHYGDRALVADHYPAVKQYVEYLASQAKPDGTHESGLGDWVAPGRHGDPAEGAAHSATAFVALVDRTAADMARLLGRGEDAERFTDLAARTTEALNKRFLDRDAGVYTTEIEAGYRQTASVLPLAFGQTPADAKAKVLENLVADIGRKGNHLDTGILGTRWLLPLLSTNGQHELAYKIATQTTYPSWGYWASKGATTMWEMWDDGSRSLDHHMFGSIDQWFYEELAGIRTAAPGYSAVTIAPAPAGDLTSASARVRTVRGDVSSSWRRPADQSFALDVTVPVGATATVSVPAPSRWAVTESGVRAEKAPGVTFVRYRDGRAVFAVGSGNYRFRAAAPPR